MVQQLKGAAKNLTMPINPQVWTGGGQIGGRRVGPMTYLMALLAEHVGELGDETALN